LYRLTQSAPRFHVIPCRLLGRHGDDGALVLRSNLVDGINADKTA
jgi:hypothetical protein